MAQVASFAGSCAMERRRTVADIHCPAINGLDDDIVHVLHHSMTTLVRLHRSLEVTDLQIKRSRDAALTSEELLKRLQHEGF